MADPVDDSAATRYGSDVLGTGTLDEGCGTEPVEKGSEAWAEFMSCRVGALEGKVSEHDADIRQIKTAMQGLHDMAPANREDIDVMKARWFGEWKGRNRNDKRGGMPWIAVQLSDSGVSYRYGRHPEMADIPLKYVDGELQFDKGAWEFRLSKAVVSGDDIVRMKLRRMGFEGGWITVKLKRRKPYKAEGAFQETRSQGGDG